MENAAARGRAEAAAQQANGVFVTNLEMKKKNEEIVQLKEKLSEVQAALSAIAKVQGEYKTCNSPFFQRARNLFERKSKESKEKKENK